jgi:signal transduction histidine kinase
VVTDTVEELHVDGVVTVVDGPVHVEADRDHVVRIVGNLVTNAGKYGAGPIEVRVRRNGGLASLEVRDHGDGVPEAFVPVMFDTFTQADRGDTRSARGLGLGLSIVASLAEANNGKVRYEPAGPGARFVVELPAVAPPAPASLRGAAHVVAA